MDPPLHISDKSTPFKLLQYMYTELVYMYNPIYNIINTYVIPDNDFLIPWNKREGEGGRDTGGGEVRVREGER